MKYFITPLIILMSIYSFSQTTYYTTDGENRITKAKANKILSEQVDNISEAMGKQYYGSLTVKETEIKKDSIIKRITFAMNTKKPKNQTNSSPLSEYLNKEFPKFDLKTLTGKSFKSKQLIGKPTMINLWYTTCKPCIEEMPVLNKIKEKYKNDFNFIAVTYEKKEDVENFLKKHPFNFKHLVNAQEFTDQLGIKSYPKNLFLDSNGVLRYAKGGIPYDITKGEEMKMGEGDRIIEIVENLIENQ